MIIIFFQRFATLATLQLWPLWATLWRPAMPLAEISMRSRSWISQASSWWIRGCKSSSSPSPSPVFLKWTGQPGFPLQRMRSSWCKAYWSRMGRMHCRFGKSWSSWQMGWSWVNHDDGDHFLVAWIWEKNRGHTAPPSRFLRRRLNPLWRSWRRDITLARGWPRWNTICDKQNKYNTAREWHRWWRNKQMLC